MPLLAIAGWLRQVNGAHSPFYAVWYSPSKRPV